MDAPKRYVCDCGASYGNLDALMACQNGNHGNPRFGEQAMRDAVIEECARVAEEGYGSGGKLAAQAIRKLKV